MAEETQTQEEVETTEATTQAPTTYTQAQLDSEADKRAAKALETAKAKWQAEQAKALEDAKSEGARLAKMTEDEKAKEIEKQRQAELDKREAELNQRELSTSTKSLLVDKGLPTEFAGSLVALGDADKIKAAVETLGKTIQETVNKQVEAKLQTNPPKNGSSALDGVEDPFKKIMAQYKKK
nr:MAG TPA: Major capsid protein [Caudoviricetes sp.]